MQEAAEIYQVLDMNHRSIAHLYHLNSVQLFFKRKNKCTYFKQAELALAAYSNLLSEIPLEDFKIALQDSGKGLSSFQATKFASTYRVVDQFNDPGTGLSATVFANDETGETSLAIRDTKEGDLRDI